MSGWHDAKEVPEPNRRIAVIWNTTHSAFPRSLSKLSQVGRTTLHKSVNEAQAVFRSDNYAEVKPSDNPENGYYIGPRYTAVISWRYLEEPAKITVEPVLTEEGAEALFTPTTAKAKGGYRAQVHFQGTVVWEGDEVYKDDPNYDQGAYEDGENPRGQSGHEKATNAAAKAVEQAVESLFTKIKV